MTRKVVLTTCIFLLSLFFGTKASALHINPGIIEPGDMGTITIPFGNMEGGVSPIVNVRITTTSIPSWITPVSDSFMGPSTIYPGRNIVFNFDFEISSDYEALNSTGEIILDLLSDSTNFVPASLTWRFTTDNGFLTMRGKCVDNDGMYCGEYISSDTFAPQSSPSFEMPEYVDEQSRLFISTFNNVYFDGFDQYDANSVISRIAVTGHKVDDPAAAFEELAISTETILLAEGQHTLYFASRDNAGNTEVIRSTVVYVDGTAPAVNLQIIGSSVTDSKGNLVISTDAYISLDGADNLSTAPASGLNWIMCSIDDVEYSVYSTTFTLFAGHHKIKFFGIDNVGNAELPHIFEFFVGAGPKTTIWSGLAGGGDWYNPGNWRNNDVPGVNDTAVLATRDTVQVGANSPALRVHNLVLGDAEGLSAPVLLISTGVVSSGKWTIHTNATLTQNTLEQFKINSLFILSGGKIEHVSNADTVQSIVNLKIGANLVIESNTVINAKGLGYAGGAPGQSGSGPGGGCGAYGNASGGGYGGQSGMPWNGCGNPGMAYGSLVNPIDLGSGGGGTSGEGVSGGSGGGAVIIDAGSIILNGVIDVSGSDSAVASNYGSGGGSGGSINIKAGTLSGGGILKADGGSSTSASGPGGGAGGRIALLVSGEDDSNLALSADRGVGNLYGGHGGAGTIYVKSGASSRLILSRTSLTSTGRDGVTNISSKTIDATDFNVSTFIVKNIESTFTGVGSLMVTSSVSFAGINKITFVGGGMGLPGKSDLPGGTTLSVSSLTVTGNLTMKSGSMLTHPANNTSKTYGLNLEVSNNLDLQHGASINADGLGYAGGGYAINGSGPGYGAGSLNFGGGGGGYGGLGGASSGGRAGGRWYQNVSAPDELGSGGGGASGLTGGAGGGVISLIVGNAFTLNGVVSANGANGNSSSNYGSGGGSGGTAEIFASGISGNGRISVSGGAGGIGSTANGGGGAGGRVSGAHRFAGVKSVAGGGAGSGAEAGQNGTWYNPEIAAPITVNPPFSEVFSSSLTVNWMGTGGTQYRAEISKQPDFSSGITSSDTYSMNIVFDKLSGSSTYYVRVAAMNDGMVASDFVSLGSTQTLRQPGETWVGSSGGDWQNPANWNNGAVPTAIDPVTINDSVLVMTYSTNPAISFASLTLGSPSGTKSLTLKLSTGTLSSGPVTVYSGAVLMQNTPVQVALAALTMYSGSLLNHAGNSNTRSSLVNLKITDAFEMQQGSSIAVKGLGYAGGIPGQSGSGPGGGCGAYGNASGGGYGGQSGMPWNGCSSPGMAYASLVNPMDIGSGGGGTSGSGITGGSGGGAVLIDAGSAVLNGVIDASGNNSSGSSFGSGGGSGGSINIKAGTLSGGGILKADGGSTAGFTGASGGAGGRIALLAFGADNSNLVLSADRGIGGYYGGHGGAGTIYIKSGASSRLVLSRTSVSTTGRDGLTDISSGTIEAANLVLNSIVFRNAGMRFYGINRISILDTAEFAGVNFLENSIGEGNFPGLGVLLPKFNDILIATMTFPAASTLRLSGATLRVSSLTALGNVILDSIDGVGSVLEQTGLSQWTIGNLTVNFGSKVTHKANSSTKQYMLNMHVLGNMNVELGGSINVDGKGYAGGISGQSGSGLGKGNGSNEGGGGGAGHGGIGGTGSGGVSGGGWYGSVSSPDDLGSGGGGANGANGGAGGGKIVLIVDQTLSMNGILSAKGEDGSATWNYGSGGGSGGTIRLSAVNIEGYGIINVNGGAGGQGYGAIGGGGAGGRVSGAHLFHAGKSVTGGAGAQAGQSGTWYDPTVSQPGIASPVFPEVGDSGLTANWTGNPGASYWAEISNKPDFSSGILSTASYNANASFTGLTGNTTYHARVAVMNNGMVASDFVSLGSTRTLRQPGETWVGPSGGDWQNPANWDNGAVPTAIDPVTINDSVLVMTYSTNPAISFASLTLGSPSGTKSSTLKLSTGTLSAGPVIIYPGAALTQNTTAQVALAALTMYSGSMLNHTGNNVTRSTLVNLKIANMFEMQQGSNITAKSLGYAGGAPGQSGSGPGGGCGAYGNASGGGYGGQSGMPWNGCGNPGMAYGSLVNPIDLGSGGGGTSGSGIPGGSGGGAVIIDAGSIILNGVIDVSGSDSTVASNYGSGGGSGGSINIKAGTLSGGGILKADGGSTAGLTGAGGGAGGRIALLASGADNSNLVLSADRGIGGYYGGHGGAGPIYVKSGAGSLLVLSRTSLTSTGRDGVTNISSKTIDATDFNVSTFIAKNIESTFTGVGSLMVTSSVSFSGINKITFMGGGMGLPGKSDLPGGTTLSVSSLTVPVSLIVGNGAILEQSSVNPFKLGALILKSGSKLTHAANGAAKLYAVNLSVSGDMEVQSGATIEATGLGYTGGIVGQNGFGSGYGYGSTANGGGGGGYGGNGGIGHGGSQGGASYGSISMPDDSGSGGGGSNGVSGGAGGGQIRLQVGSILTVNGVINANGASGGSNGSYGGGGGSGGSIYVTAGGLAGSGPITANGGAGGAGSIRGGGAGSGGRLAGVSNVAGVVTVLGGAGGGLAQAGGFGSIGAYMAVATQTINTAPEASVSAVKPVEMAALDNGTTQGSMVLATSIDQSLYPVSTVYSLGPEGETFNPPLIMTFRYSDEMLRQLNILEQDIYVYHYDAQNGLVKVPGQLRDTQRKEITIQLSQITSIFGIFGPPSNTTPPITALQILGESGEFGGSLYANIKSSVVLSAYAPVVAGTAASIAFTEFRVDADSSTAFTRYSLPFWLSEGRHVVEFRSQDSLANIEAVKSAVVHVDGTLPETTARVEGKAGPNNWYISAATVTLVSSDSISGISRINYRIEGGGYDTDDKAYTGPLTFITDGIYALYYYSRDTAGNMEVEKHISFKLDISTPVASAVIRPLPNSRAWNNTPVEVMFAGSDTVSGIAYCSSSVTVSQYGLNVPVSGYCADYAGWSSTASITLNIDTATPASVADLNGTIGGHGWYISTVTIQLASTDTLSGVSEVYYSSAAGGVRFSTQSYQGEIVAFSGEGRHTVYYHAEDKAGNIEGEITAQVGIDLSSPIVNVTASPSPNENGWNRTPVTTVFTGTDTASGIVSCSQDLLIESEGSSRTISGYCMDYAGWSSTATLKVSIDTTAPNLSYVVEASSNVLGWYNSEVAVKFVCADALSGVGSCPEDIRFTDEGLNISTVAAAHDLAGNSKEISMWGINIDRTTPLSTAAISGVYRNGWYSSMVTVVLASTDALSGAAKVVYRLEGAGGNGEDQTYSEPLNISVNGLTMLRYYAEDKAGNREAWKVIEFKIDTSRPLVAYTQAPEANYTEWNNTPVTLVFSGTDTLSGVEACSSETVLTEGAAQKIAGWCRDIAGNIGYSTATINMDRAAPAISISSPVAGQIFVATRGSIYFKVGVKDNLDPAPAFDAFLAQVEDRGSPRGGRPAIIHVAPGQSIEPLDIDDGMWRLSVSATDFADNASLVTGGSFEVIHDVLPPRTTLSTAGDKYQGVGSAPYVTARTTFTLSSIDDLVSAMDNSGLGVKKQGLSVRTEAIGLIRQLLFENTNPGQGATFVSAFRLDQETDGIYGLSYNSEDVLGNIEKITISTFIVDNTVPQTAFNRVSGPAYLNYVSTWTLFELSPEDPGAFASGVKETSHSINNGAVSTSLVKFTLPGTDGNYLVKYHSRDNVENLEVEKSSSVYMDATPPVTSFNIAEPLYIKDGVRYITPASELIFTAADPLANTAAAGVERIETAIDGGQWLKYTQALKFAEGRHTIKYRAIDNVGNIEAERALEVQCDNTAPVSKWSVSSGERIERAGKFYLNALGSVALESADPLAANVASGLENIYYGIDAAPATKYSSVFGLGEGVRILNCKAKDNLGNTEVVKSTAIYVDGTKPVTELTVSGDQYKSDRQYISQRTDIIITAADPVVNEVSVGVKETKYAVDSGGFGDYSQFKLSAEGKRVVSFYSADHVNNVEAVKTSELWVDATAPLSTLNIIGGRQYAGMAPGSFYASLTTEYGFAAVDPVANGGAAGAKAIEYADNGGLSAVYAQPLALGEGKHTITYRAKDRVENIEVFRSTQIYVDNTAPVTAFNISEPLFLKDGVRYITPASELTFTAADPLAGEVAAGVERIETAIDSGPWLLYTQALKFTEGRHTIKYRAIDNVGNVEVERSLEVQCDNTAPVSKWSVSSGEWIERGSKFYFNSLGRIALESADPLVNNVASGLENIYYGIDGAPAAKYTSVFGLGEGVRIVNYKAVDNVGNIEVVKSTVIYVDGTKPVTELSISGDQYKNDKQYISQRTDIVITAADPVVNEVSVGVKETKYAVDGGAFADYSQFKLSAEGKRVVSFYSADHVNNVETVKTAELWVDATAPSSALNIIGGSQYTGTEPGIFFASLATEFSFAAWDPVAAGGAAGVKKIEYADNGGTLKVYSQSISLGEGKHTITYRATDRVENIEVFKSTQIYVDNTAPVTIFNISEPLYIKDGVRYITPASGLTFTAADPVIKEVSVGVEHIETAVDGGQWLNYTQALKFAEGRHTIKYRAYDNVGNLESAHTLEVQSDATAPESRWLASSGDRIEKGGKFYLNALGRIALESVDPVVGAVASGVEGIYYGIDAVATNKYAATFGLTEGIRTVNFSAKDNVTNIEVVKSTVICVDGTKPVTELTVSGDQYKSDRQYISQRTDIVITAVDPVMNEVAVGVKETKYAVDGGAFISYSQFKLNTEGKRVVSFYSVDYVNNVEAVKTSELWVDITAPATGLTISGVRYQAPGDDMIYITRDSSIVLTPTDPLSNDTASGVMLTKYRVNGGNWQVYVGSITIAAEGPHTLEYYSLDRVQNAETLKIVKIAVDNTQPLSKLTTGLPKYELAGYTLVSTKTILTLEAADPLSGGIASGLSGIYYSITASAGPAPVVPYFTPFALASRGMNTVRWWSVDNVRNAEPPKAASYELDDEPPVLKFDCPGESFGGICNIYNSTFTVYGTVSDRYINSWRLEYAPGVDAQGGYLLISSGSVNITAAAIGRWNPAGLDGPYTLRLSAADLVENAGVKYVNIRIGKPSVQLSLGGRGGMFKKPEGAVADVQGRLYIADTGNDRVAVYTSTGGFVRYYGVAEHDDEDKDEASGVPHLDEPAGLAVDDGAVYIADAGNRRVLKLSYEGKVLTIIGGRSHGEEDDHEHKFSDGRKGENGGKPGLFRRPHGLALDAAGNIYVTDSKAGSVQKVSPEGKPLLRITLPPVDKPVEDEEADEEEDENDPALAKPAGIAVDSAGNIYVADMEGARVFKYGPAGELLSVITDKAFKKPYGIAVSPDGQCLIVTDTGAGFIHKLDREGRKTLSFGRERSKEHEDGELKPDNDNSGSKTGKSAGKDEEEDDEDDEEEGRGDPLDPVFKEPGLAAFGPGGELYVSDKKTYRIVKLGRPVAAPIVVPARSAKKGFGKSAFARISSNAAALTGPDPAFKLGEVYVFPNPAKGSEVPVFHIETGIADSVKITIYTISGRAAHEQTLTGLPVELDDGNGLSYAYEYVWRGHIPSGVYLYYIEAQKSGQKLKKTGKFGVVR